MPKRTRYEDFQPKPAKDKFKVPKLHNTCFKNLALASGQPNGGGVLEFELILRENEWARFVDTPFFTRYRATYQNPDYDPNATEGATTIVRHNVRADAFKPPVLVPPDQGLACLFSKVEVFVDGVLVGSDTDMSGHNRIYQHLNRIYSNAAARKKLNQNVLLTTGRSQHKTELKVVLNSTVENGPGVTGTFEEYTPQRTRVEYEKAAVRTSHSSEVGPESLFDAFTLDGNFAVSQPFNHALATLRGEPNQSKYFPPGTVLQIRLHPRQPRLSLLDWTENPSYKDLFKKEKILDANDKRAKTMDITLLELGMRYQLTTLRSEQTKMLLRKSALNYDFDSVFIDKMTLEPNHSQLVLHSRVPKGSKLVYLAFALEHFLWYNENSNHQINNYLQIPPALRKMQVMLPGHGHLLGESGLRDLGGGRAHSSPTVRTYYDNLLNQGLTDVDFDDMFPVQTERDVPLVQSLLIDLQPYRLKDQTKIDIIMDFDGSTSPKLTKLVACYVIPKKMTRRRDGTWKLE